MSSVQYSLQAVSSSIFGIIIGVVANGAIGASYVIQKKGHQMATDRSKKYYLNIVWILGILVMLLGEAGNFFAYGMAPASLVASLGAVSVVVTSVLARIILKEYMHWQSWIGTVMTIIGTCLIIICSPEEVTNVDAGEITVRLSSTVFITYLIFVVDLIIVLLIAENPKGKKNVIVYIMLCSAIGGVMVISAKSLSSFILSAAAQGENQFVHPIAYLFIGVIVFAGGLQMHYLNKSLGIYGASEVIPVYFVLFTLSCVIGASILFNEFTNMSVLPATGFGGGLVINWFGIYLVKKKPPEQIKKEPILHDPEVPNHTIFEPEISNAIELEYYSKKKGKTKEQRMKDGDFEK
jgi:drug/metabolite transporter (DMT)-like permease